MTKGRKAMTSSAKEGLWFRHCGEQGDGGDRLQSLTSTRAMLMAPFSAPVGPRTPPEPFCQKDKEIYNHQYPFTQHDNRNYFQDHGVYFGNGQTTRHLGRRLHQVGQRLHHTDTSFLHHRCRNSTLHDYNPTTATSYTAHDLVQQQQQQQQPSLRRFPRVYHKTNQNSEKTTDTTRWTNSNYKTPMQVLASTQEPFLDHNVWKYSHHGLTDVYPSYNRKKRPAVPNVLNRYGPDFACGPDLACMTARE